MLKSQDYNINVIDVTNDDELFQNIQAKTGWDTVPQIFIGDEFIGGCDDLVKIHSNNELHSLVNSSD